ncbi:MAG: leucyl aminopeptidase [Pseudomonadota bacterium]
MKIKFAETVEAEIVAFIVDEDGALPAEAKDLDAESSGLIGEALEGGRFTGKLGQQALVVMPKSASARRAVLIGGGKPAQRDSHTFERIGAEFVRAQQMSGFKSAGLFASSPQAAASLAAGAKLAAYRFDKYFTTLKDTDTPSLVELTLSTGDPTQAVEIFSSLEAEVEGTYFARDLVNMAPNDLYPESFARELGSLEDLGIEVSVLDESDMRKLGMGCLLGVGQGSDKDSQMVMMRWAGADDKDAAPIALVGKGVCFDTGGISIKPGAGMEDMRGDMGGAAAVSGAMKALALRKAKANVVGLVGLVENMPDGNAIKPGDVLTSASGQTVEVQNTDAEGRLVLADVLWYAQEHVKAKAIVDLATLTGAVVISLGHHHAGLFSSDDDMAGELTAAGLASGERVWRLPLGPEYDRLLKSKFADMRNIGGRAAGSITAAQFLKRFVGDETPWCHLDIAGVAWVEGEKAATDPAWGSGFGPRLLSRWIETNYED